VTPSDFDAVLDFPVAGEGGVLRAEADLPAGRVPASFTDYGAAGRPSAPFVRVRLSRHVDVRWNDEFVVLDEGGRALGRGTCLYPQAPSPEELKAPKRKALLEKLARGEKEMLLALTEDGGLKGLREETMTGFCRLDPGRLEGLARALEEEGRVRILAFSPLFLVAQEALDFLTARIASYLARFHSKHPGRRGASLDKIEKRFAASRPVLLLAVRALGKAGRVVSEGDLVWLADFRISLTDDDERVLGELERMFVEGRFSTATMDEIRKEFRLTPQKLQTLMAVLTERKRIVEGRDGFIVHSQWLEDLVKRVRGSGKGQLSVADFKAMTGLSRKYAIPLLELLDEMGVTRRKGSFREIL
jgi:selenocysteine-specific elongation factor